VQLVLRAVGGLGDAHLRHRHLRHIHEDLDAVMARHRSGVDRGLQIGRRDRHAEIDARAAFDGAVHRGEIRQVTLHDLGAKPAQGDGALVLPADQRAYLVALGEQHCGEVATDGADGTGSSGHEDWAVRCGFHHRSGSDLVWHPDCNADFAHRSNHLVIGDAIGLVRHAVPGSLRRVPHTRGPGSR